VLPLLIPGGVWAGAALSRLQPGEDVISNNVGLLVFLLALSIAVALIPTLIKKCGSASMMAAQVRLREDP